MNRIARVTVVIGLLVGGLTVPSSPAAASPGTAASGDDIGVFLISDV